MNIYLISRQEEDHGWDEPRGWLVRAKDMKKAIGIVGYKQEPLTSELIGTASGPNQDKEGVVLEDFWEA